MSILVSLILCVVATIHALWGFGIWIPIRDEPALARAVVGAKGVSRMPGPIPCFLVAGGLLFLVLMLWMPAGIIRSAVLWLATAGFLARGAMPYTALWRKMTPEEPFASNDRRYFGPLCIGLGLALLLIQIGVF